jgi:hypothetical protein
MRRGPVLSGQNIETVQFLVGLSIHYSLYCTDFAAHLACTWKTQLKIVVTQSEALVPGVIRCGNALWSRCVFEQGRSDFRNLDRDPRAKVEGFHGRRIKTCAGRRRFGDAQAFE